jgi:cytochrome c
MVYRLTIAIACLVLCLPDLADAGSLHEAAKAGDVVQIASLLDAGADINEKSTGGTPLFLAINAEHVEAAELLIQRGADVNARSTLGTPLHAAATRGMTSMAGLLLEHGADPNADWNTLTPLHNAAKFGQIDVARTLLDHGADINALTDLDEPPLHLALIYKHTDVADLLRERGTKAPALEDIAPLLALADVQHGGKVAQRCHGCHSIDRQAKLKSGPPLWDIVGRTKASYPGFKYSDALKATAGQWSYADLNEYIAHPAWTVPGIAMKAEGIHKPQDRADLIAFLRSLSDHPAPLP